MPKQSLKSQGLAFLGKVKADQRKVNKGKKVQDEDQMDDEIDAFMKQRDKIAFNSAEDDAGGSDFEEVDEVYGLNVDDSEDEEDEVEEDDSYSQRWGKDKDKFYNTDLVEEDLSSDEEEEVAKEEEEEAKRLQKKQAEMMTEEDFDDTNATLGARVKQNEKKSKKPSKKSDAGILDAFNRDLEQISFDFEAGDVEVEKVTKKVSSMSATEKLEIIASESPELLEFLEEFKKKILEVKEKIQPILSKVRSGEFPQSKGISYLEVKMHLLLSYLTHISFYLLLKAQGKSVKDHPVIDQLVRLRTILEKTKPLDQKLKNQIDKLLKIAVMGNTDSLANDPRSFKPNPEDLADEDEEEEEEDKTGIYQPPRLSEVHFDEGAGSKQRRQEERAKKRASRSIIMKEIQQEFSEQPEEIAQIGAVERDDDDREREIQQYEEDNFLRMQFSKKDQNKKKRQMLRDDLETFADFGAIAGLGEEDSQEKHSILQKKNMRKVLSDLGKKDSNGTSNGGFKRKQSRDDSDEDLSEDDFYKQAAQAANSKRQKKQQDDFEDFGEEDDGADGQSEARKRGITKAIQSNRGLTRARNKETKHARTKLRNKYEKAVQRRKGAVRPMRDRSAPYSGEATGIKSNVTRSVSLRS